MKRPHRPYRAAAWHRAHIEQQAAARDRLWAALGYLTSVLQSMPPEIAERVAEAAADDLVDHAEEALSRAPRRHVRVSR